MNFDEFWSTTATIKRKYDFKIILCLLTSLHSYYAYLYVGNQETEIGTIMVAFTIKNLINPIHPICLNLFTIKSISSQRRLRKI